MLALIERIRERLAQGAYANEAAVSHGIVTPILNALGWDSADPDHMVPEFSIVRGRVDFALFGLGHRPAVFIEVKGIGRAVEGDRQLFEYSFHEGVPLCVLTDGREWSFYVPAGQGSYEDRRVYRLQLDDRDPAQCERILTRYLSRERVRNGAAFEDAQRDYRDAAGRREAATALPRAWDALLTESETLLIDIVGDRAEALCGFKPSAADVLQYLRRLRPGEEGTVQLPRSGRSLNGRRTAVGDGATTGTPGASHDDATIESADRSVTFSLFGKARTCPTASFALIEILKELAMRDPTKIPALAEAVRGRTRNLIARSVAEINPARPDLARSVEFAPGWLIGLNISNREKMAIVRTACEIFGLRMPEDIDLTLPNAP
jgi:hypothetical protein